MTIRIIYGDNFASGLVQELWMRNGLRYEPVQLNKSQLYINLLGIINSRRIELLDDKKMIQELVNLERRTGFAGRDRVDHPDGNCHDDSANVIAGIAHVTRDNNGAILLDMRMRAYGMKPTIFEERTRAKLLADEAKKQKARDAEALKQQAEHEALQLEHQALELQSHEDDDDNL